MVLNNHTEIKNSDCCYNPSPVQTDDITELAKTYSETKDKSLRERLAGLAMPYVTLISKIMRRKLSPSTDLDALVSDGNLGLLEAMERYNPEKYTNFKTYLSAVVKARILDGIIENGSLSRVDIRRLKKMNCFRDFVITATKRKPSYEECREYWLKLGLPSRSFDDFYYSVFLPRNNKKGNGIKGITAFAPIKDNQTPEPVENLQKKELFEQLNKDLQAIPQKYRRMLYAHLIEDVLLKNAAASVGLSEYEAWNAKKRYFGKENSDLFFRRTREYLRNQ